MPVDLKRRLEQFRKDGQVTTKEWRSVKMALEKTPLIANPVARAVLDVWADDRLRIEVDARISMRNYLVSRGYPVPDADEPTPSMVPAIVAQNVSEPDVEFERLSKGVGRPKQTTTIAVLDTGFDLGHPELKAKVWKNAKEVPANGKDDDANGFVDDVHGWDFVDKRGELQKEMHGTHVSGIATQGTQRVKEMALRVIGPIDGQKVADAIDYAAAQGARLVNMSIALTTPEDTAKVRAAIERHPEVLFLKSAGNDGRQLGEGEYAPERYLSANQLPNMLVVAAADADGKPASYSNFGAPYATLAARGTAVLSTTPGGRYFDDDGTSMATPNVTAVAAKCLALDPALSPAQLRKLLVTTGDARPDWTSAVASGGLISASRAMQVAALTGLMRAGKSTEDACEMLKLAAGDRPALVELSRAVLAG